MPDALYQLTEMLILVTTLSGIAAIVCLGVWAATVLYYGRR